MAGATLLIPSSLVAKSLLRRVAAPRYELHELVRQHARGRLEGEPAAFEETTRRHAAVYARLLEQRGPGLRGPSQPQVIAELVEELGNIRGAMGNVWSIASSLDLLGAAAHKAGDDAAAAELLDEALELGRALDDRFNEDSV